MLKNCPDCGGELEKGLIPDTSVGGIKPLMFFKTEILPPSDGWPFGKIPLTEEYSNVIAYRCIKCNRIFNYAEDKQNTLKSTRKRIFTSVVWAFIITIGVLVILSVIFALILPH